MKKASARLEHLSKICPDPGIIQAKRQITDRFQRVAVPVGGAASAFLDTVSVMGLARFLEEDSLISTKT